MANQLPEEKRRTAPTGKPLQRLPWTDKIAKNYEWFKENVDYRIGASNLGFNNTQNAANASKRDLRTLYNVYNNQFPLSWFSHITDPLNATNPQHKNYPAKVRPTGMLRTNLDLLLGEYPKRPYVYQVANMGEEGYNTYLDEMAKTIQSNVQEHFLAIAQQSMKAAGHEMEEIPQDEEIPMPETVKDRFTSSYKDNLARRGQRWIKRAIREYNVRQKQLKMFKDWLIVGMARSYKNIENGSFIYERVPPQEIDFDKSPNVEFIEDAEWVIRRQLLTVSDVVDKFYDELSAEEHDEIERKSFVSPLSMYNYLDTTYSSEVHYGKVPVYHVQWKGKKPIKFYNYTDPITGEAQELMLDESVPADENLKLTKTEWVNEVYEGWRIGDNIFTRMRALPVQRNEMNNFSSCKLSYNGKNYSDTHSENISVLEMGLPYAIMYMITNFTLEKTIAKNKGKITLFDQNAIPKGDGWDEEKFFYYADALGYMMLNRNQQGVDKSWNQYTTLDMSLFDQIKELINLRDSYKRDWDDLLGISPQRKAQTNSSDGLGTTQTNLFQSSLMTDMIFTLFEEFTEKELQGMLDYSKFINVDGIRAIYNEDDFDRELLDIDPNSYCSAELGLFIKHSAEEQRTLEMYKNQVQAMIQNGVKQSTILEIQQANNVAELMDKLKRIEEIEAQQAAAQAENEHEREIAIEQTREKFLRLQSLLKQDEINVEYDRKESLAMVEGEYNLFGFGGDGDNNDNGIPDAVEIGKRVIAQQKILADERNAQMEISSRERIHKDQMSLSKDQMALEEKKIESKEKTDMAKVKAMKIKARSAKK